MSLAKSNKTTVIKDFGVTPHDTGSTAVQIALLTERIKQISEHLIKNPKDVSSKRGLLLAVAQRRKFLTYLHKKDAAHYKQIVTRLGLRK